MPIDRIQTNKLSEEFRPQLDGVLCLYTLNVVVAFFLFIPIRDARSYADSITNGHDAVTFERIRDSLFVVVLNSVSLLD